MKPIISGGLSAVIACVLFWLAPAPALAGEWLDATSRIKYWDNVIFYKGNFNEGEFAHLFYDSRSEFSRSQRYRLIMLLNNGSAAITGFNGVHLAVESGGPSLLDLSYKYDPKLGSLDMSEHAGEARDWDDIGHWHACFRTRPTNIDSKHAVPCDTGEGTWIYIQAIGQLEESNKNGFNCRDGESTIDKVLENGSVWKLCSPGPNIRAANKLVIGAVNGKHTSFNLTIDDKFRRALWDDELWREK
ncbi:MAG: hypothetical protein K8F90_17770 [Hyphomicrobiales bacterium]|nr:hypothetical protein [Hyphomicrobiales bacterium]